MVARPRDGLWAVADGMGGHLRGEWASACIAERLHEVALSEGFDEAVGEVAAALRTANDLILDAAQKAGGAIGSTVAVLVVRGMRFSILWAGDSRIYRCRGTEITLLTTDHSQVEQLVAAGLLERSEAESHPLAHVLTHAVGVRADLVLDVIAGELLPGDVFLLCSDGLSRLVGADELQRVLALRTPKGAATALVDIALERGAPDNVTVAVVGCDATTLVAGGL